MGWMLLRMLFSALISGLIALISGLIWKLVTDAVSGASDPRPRGAKPRMALVRDPVCGTYVEPSGALSTRAGGMTHYFCSKDCQRSFVETADAGRTP